MKIVEIVKPWDTVNLYPIGDVHLGDKNCDLELVEQTIKAAAEDPHGLVILMGDILNVATKQSVGKAVFDQDMDTTAQMKLAKQIFTPVKDKIIGSLEGNHEFRLSKEGLNIAEVLADSIGIEFLGFSSIINLKFNGGSYIIYVTHGHGTASTPGAALNKMNKLTSVVEADIYIKGHNHKLVFNKEPIRFIDSEKNQIVQKDRYFVDSGAFLKYDDSYAEQANMALANLGSPIIHLTRDKVRISI